jgi:hypothetical protein
MKDLPLLPDGYFDKFSTKPVKVKPFNPKSKIIAEKYIDLLKELLKEHNFKILHRGSTAYEISGKGDIEIGIYPSERDWNDVIVTLETKFGAAGNIEDDYVRFNTSSSGFDIEIILFRGMGAQIDVAKNQYLLEHKDILKKYEGLKKKYSYSKREYQHQKYKFLRKVVESIPG